MKQLLRNNYIELSLVKGILLGLGYDNEILVIMVGCFALEVKLYMFKPTRKNKTQTF